MGPRPALRGLAGPLLAAALASCAADPPAPTATPTPSPTPLTLGTAERPVVLLLAPSADPDRALALGRDLASELERPSGLRWDVRLPRSDAESLEDLCGAFGEVAVLGQLTTLLATRQNCAAPVLALVRPEGAVASATFRRDVIVRADGPASLSALRGGAIAHGDERSSPGSLAVLLLVWRELRVDPLTFFERSLSLGDHDAAREALARGDVDAASVAPPALAGLRVLATTPALPNEPVVVRIGVGDELTARIRAALLEVAGTDRGRAILEELYGATGLAPAAAADYEPFREAAVLGEVDLEAEAARTPRPRR
ncbi:MAG TPA: PhnD/SsuA/transferrin family substrate-binding protein [Candidatus Limnocylindrales bacterium]|nr:PhnD/SsuA/transferrin family substrate-binding protein [Candidatus Limnocylindrales bacterium]